jgi:hypothetical protein
MPEHPIHGLVRSGEHSVWFAVLDP